MDKLFTIAGTSTLNGVNTYRFATGKVNVRAAKLRRHGHTDVDLVQLPNEMSKTDAVAYLVTLGRDAVLPTNRKDKPIELTPEQKEEAAKAAEKAAFVRRMAEARAAKKAAQVAAQDANFLADITGGERVEVPADDETTGEEVTAGADTVQVEAGVNELLEAVGVGADEFGVDKEREIAGEG
jgi:hypothetical protein